MSDIKNKAAAQNELHILSNSEFDIFFKENYHIACLVALRYLSDVSEVEDLVQEAFVLLWEKRENIKIKSSLRNYFLKMIKNHSLKSAQRSKASFIPLASLFADPPEEDTSLEMFSEEELAVRIHTAIEELPPACRTIFKMAYQDGLSYQQISDKLNISKNTVKTQMGIAYRHLRSQLKSFINCLLTIFFSKKP